MNFIKRHKLLLILLFIVLLGGGSYLLWSLSSNAFLHNNATLYPTKLVSTSTPTVSPTPTCVFPNLNGINIDNSYENKLVNISAGKNLVLTLDGVTWKNIQSSDSSILSYMSSCSDPVIGGPLGSGSGTIVTIFKALKAGKAEVTASRTYCGEAMPCTSSNESFKVDILVKN